LDILFKKAAVLLRRYADMIKQELVLQMKELIKFGRERGRVLPVSEAFKMYPVEEEAHKGELDYWLKGEKKLEV
jgi:hypothetical protein